RRSSFEGLRTSGESKGRAFGGAAGSAISAIIAPETAAPKTRLRSMIRRLCAERATKAILAVSAGGRDGLHLSRAERENRSGSAGDREDCREARRRAGLFADEQRASAARALQSAWHRHARASHRGRHRQAGDQGQDARAEKEEGRGARRARCRSDQKPAAPDSPPEPSDSRPRRPDRLKCLPTVGGAARPPSREASAGR